MSKMFFKYTESWHIINVNAFAYTTENGRNELTTLLKM